MGVPFFDGDDLSAAAYGILSGSSTPLLIIYPRTIGGIIQESGVIDKSINVKNFIKTPIDTSRRTVEEFHNALNERIGSKTATLSLNGNSYLRCDVKSINFDNDIVDNFIKFTINFQIGDQNKGGTIRQLSVPDLQDFTRGRQATFKTRLEDFSLRTFTFWHNMDKFRNFETQITVKHTDSFGGGSRVLRVGGFERIRCECWLIGLDNEKNRQNIEAFFFNMINGPLGRIGTLTINGEILTDTFFESADMADATTVGIRYNLTFLKSLAC